MRNWATLLLFSPLPFLAEGNLKSYCVVDDDDDCDSDWTPFPNMASSLVGYDLSKGNPFAMGTIEDPGLRKQIFNVSWEDTDTGDYVMETGIAMRAYKMCDADFKSKTATNMRQYEKILAASSLTGFGYEVGIEVESPPKSANDSTPAVKGLREGMQPPVSRVAWQKTREYESVRQFLFTSRGAVVVSEAQCITHKVDVSHFLTPGFHPAFLEVLRFLEKQEGRVRQSRAFKRFVRDYGTHFVSSSLMGAKIAAVTFHDGQERVKFGRQRLLNCSEAFVRDQFGLGLDIGGEDEEEDNEDEDEDDEAESRAFRDLDYDMPCPFVDPSNSDRALVSTYGTPPPESDSDMDSWDEEMIPIPVKFELTPIVNLFTQENLDERHGISSEAILRWFLPLYLDFCDVFGFDCSRERGCGFDDNCDFEEDCVVDVLSGPGRYRCQAPSWADLPNWPELQPAAASRIRARLGTKVRTRESANNRRTSNEISSSAAEPDSPNIRWFFEKDTDHSGSLTMSELWIRYTENDWYNQRYQTAMDTLMLEADVNGDRAIDMDEYIRLHSNHPWYAEQITFMLMNTDNNHFLTRGEIIEASRISPDLYALNFNDNQIENVVDGLLSAGDVNADGKISFEEYVAMTRDVFIDNFAPSIFKRVMS